MGLFRGAVVEEWQIDGHGIVIGDAFRDAVIQRFERATVVGREGFCFVVAFGLGESGGTDEDPVEFVLADHPE